MSASGGELEVLRCGQCGAPVPLGDGDRVPCPGCGAQVEVPEPYRVARAAARLDAEGQALCARLGAPPGTLQRMLASGVYIWVFLFLLPFLLRPLGAIAHLLLLDPIAAILHVRLADVLGAGTYGAVYGAAVFAIIAPLAIIGSHGRRQVRARRALQAGLAAKPPATPGGPALCRCCGAPLAVPPGAAGVRCSYCRADNLVALQPDWVASAKVGSATLRTQIADAADEDRKNRVAIRRGTTIRLVLLALLAVGYYAFFRFVLGSGENVWAEWIVRPRVFSPFTPEVLADDQPTGDRILASTMHEGHPGRTTLAPIDDGRCTAAYMFAARHGEHVVVQLAPDAPPVGVAVQASLGMPFGRGHEVAVRPGGHAELALGRSGLYEIVLDGGTRCGPLTLTLSISPRR